MGDWIDLELESPKRLSFWQMLRGTGSRDLDQLLLGGSMDWESHVLLRTVGFERHCAL